MAFPTVQTSAESADTTATTSHVITMPSGITAGDILVAHFLAPTNADPLTIPGDWAQMPLFDAATDNMASVWKVAAGGDSLTITSAGSVKSAHIATRISGGSSVEGSAGVSNGGTLNPNPPSFTPSGGSKDYLWIAVCFQTGEEADDDTWATAPASYSNLLMKTSGTAAAASSNSSVAIAFRQATGSSEDPGTFTVAQSLAVWTQTLAVFPVVPAFAPPPGILYDPYRHGPMIRR